MEWTKVDRLRAGLDYYVYHDTLPKGSGVGPVGEESRVYRTVGTSQWDHGSVGSGVPIDEYGETDRGGRGFPVVGVESSTGDWDVVRQSPCGYGRRVCGRPQVRYPT